MPSSRRVYRSAHVSLAHLYHSLGELSEAESKPSDARHYYQLSIDNFEAVQFQGPPFARVLEEYSRLIQPSDKKVAKALHTRARKMASAFSEFKQQGVALGY